MVKFESGELCVFFVRLFHGETHLFANHGREAMPQTKKYPGQMKASCTRVHCFRFIRVRKRRFRTRRRLVPALDLAADLDLDFGWVAVKDDVD